MGISNLNEDKRIGDQVEFVYEEALKWKPQGARNDPPPVCIACFCKIYQFYWSPATEYKRRTGFSSFEDKPYEIPTVGGPPGAPRKSLSND